MGNGARAGSWRVALCLGLLVLAGVAAADPLDAGTPASAVQGVAVKESRPAGDGESGGRFRWPVVVAALLLLASLGMLIWSFDRACRRFLRRSEEWQVAKLRARRMLYPDVTVDEARRMLWAWEEMTESERSELPLARRVEMRQLAADLEEHERRWRRR